MYVLWYFQRHAMQKNATSVCLLVYEDFCNDVDKTITPYIFICDSITSSYIILLHKSLYMTRQ